MNEAWDDAWPDTPGEPPDDFDGPNSAEQPEDWHLDDVVSLGPGPAAWAAAPVVETADPLGRVFTCRAAGPRRPPFPLEILN